MNVGVPDLSEKSLWEKTHFLRNSKVWGLIIKKWKGMSEK